MNLFSHRLPRLVICFPYWLALLTVSSLFSSLAVAESPSPQSVERSSKRSPGLSSPMYACWKLSYRLNDIAYQSQLKLEDGRGTLAATMVNSTTKPSATSERPVRVSDVDTNGWLRQQQFLWFNRIKQRSTTERELALVSQRIKSGSLNGRQLETAQQFQQALQALLSSSNPQAVGLNAVKAEAVERFRQTQQMIKGQAQEAEQQLETQVEQRRQQIITALRDPNAAKKLDAELKQIEVALNSNQLQGTQRTQLELARKELQALRANPNSVNQRAKEFRDQRLQDIRNRRQSLLEQAQGDLTQQMLTLDSGDNGLMVVPSGTSRNNLSRQVETRSPAFSLQIKNGTYTAQACNANGVCVPVEVTTGC
jgi:hypothetical protein